MRFSGSEVFAALPAFACGFLDEGVVFRVIGDAGVGGTPFDAGFETLPKRFLNMFMRKF